MRILLRSMIVIGVAAVLLGCATVVRQSHFTACEDPQCPRCHGTKSYRCEECLGRGKVPCKGCKGTGRIKCYTCGGDGVLPNGGKCACALGLGPVGFKPCPVCGGSGFDDCRTCRGKGMVPCGTTTYDWVCRQCGARFDYPAKVCPACGAGR